MMKALWSVKKRVQNDIKSLGLSNSNDEAAELVSPEM